MSVFEPQLIKESSSKIYLSLTHFLIFYHATLVEMRMVLVIRITTKSFRLV